MNTQIKYFFQYFFSAEFFFWFCRAPSNQSQDQRFLLQQRTSCSCHQPVPVLFISALNKQLKENLETQLLKVKIIHLFSIVFRLKKSHFTFHRVCCGVEWKRTKKFVFSIEFLRKKKSENKSSFGSNRLKTD